MVITASYLRQNLYTILDEVAATGTSPAIVRKGVKLHIVADIKPDIFKRLQKHPSVLKGDPDAIVHSDWSRHWHHDLP